MKLRVRDDVKFKRSGKQEHFDYYKSLRNLIDHTVKRENLHVVMEAKTLKTLKKTRYYLPDI